MPTYPAGVYSRPDPIPALMSTVPTHSTILGQYGDEIEAIEGILGTNPQGAFATVKAWLTDLTTRVGLKARKAATQSVPDATLTAISFDTEDEDTDGFITVPSATVTVPAGKGGIYVVTVEVFVAAVTTGQVTIRTSTGTTNNHNFQYTGPNQNPAATIVQSLVAGNTLTVLVQQNSGGAANVTARLEMYRVAA